MRRPLFLLLLLALLAAPLAAQGLKLQTFKQFTTNYPGTYGTIGCTFDGSAGLFHVSYFPSGTVYSFDFNGKVKNTFSTSSWPVKAPSPNGITYSPATKLLYLVDNTGDTVTCCDSTGKYVTGWTFTAPSTNPVGISWNHDNGTLSMSSNNIISEWTTTGTRIQAGTVNYSLGIISGVAHVPQTGNFLLTQSGGTNIYEVDPSGKLISTTPLSSYGITNTQDVNYDPRTGFLTVICNSTLTLHIFIYKPNGPITFGLTCPGSGGHMPARSWSGSLARGQTATFNLSRVMGRTPAIQFLGNSNTRFGPFTLPLDLTPMGATGCFLNTKPLIFASALTSGTGAGAGTATIRLTVPNDPTLLGATLYDQWLVADQAANPMGLIASTGGTLTIY